MVNDRVSTSSKDATCLQNLRRTLQYETLNNMVKQTAYSIEPTYNIKYTIYSIHHTAYIIQHKAYRVQHIPYSIQYTTYGIQCTASSIQNTAFSVRVIRIQRTSDTSVDITFERLLCVANSKLQIWGSSLQVQKDLWKSSQHISSSSLLSLRCSPRMRAARRFSHSELGSAGPRPLKERRPYGVWDQKP